MSGTNQFPQRAYIQTFDGRMAPESKLVQEEMNARSVPVILLTTEQLLAHPPKFSRDDLVVGDFDWTRFALKQLGVAMPEPPDYPACLQHLLHRKIWTTTLADVAAQLRASPGERLFLKPSEDTKAFSGLVASADEWVDYLVESFPGALPVVCSELVEMLSEYRVYCVAGKPRAVCRYLGPEEPALDAAVVEEAARLLRESAEGAPLQGCGIDFAVMRLADGRVVTGLVEVNDGYSLGAYEGVSAKDYTDMLVARWARLVTI